MFIRQRIFVTYTNWERVRNSEVNRTDTSTLSAFSKTVWNSNLERTRCSKLAIKYETHCSFVKKYEEQISKWSAPLLIYKYLISEYFRKKEIDK